MELILLNYFIKFLIFQMDLYMVLIDRFPIDKFIIDMLVDNLVFYQNCFMFVIFQLISYWIFIFKLISLANQY